jgi:hypothetical protein
MKIWKCIFLILAAAPALASPADGPSLSGKWQIRMMIGSIGRGQVCTLEQTGVNLSVRCGGGMGANELTGTVHGRKVSWASPLNGAYSPQTFQGVLISPSKIEGMLIYMPQGNGGDFTATRCPADDDDDACRAAK